MRFSAITDVGKVRELNEDSYAVFEAGKYGFMIVADGMGGHNAGEVASSAAVDMIKEFIMRNANGMELRDLLVQSIRLANEFIYHKAKSDSSCRAMGTTVVVCCISGKSVYFANVGDSRGYVIAKDGIHQITKDDSMVAELVRRGEISAEDAKNHPQRNVITKAVGSDEYIEPGLFRTVCREGDTVLVCSDGLYGFLEDIEIQRAVSESEDLDKALKGLTDTVNSRGGNDNITATAVKIGEADA